MIVTSWLPRGWMAEDSVVVLSRSGVVVSLGVLHRSPWLAKRDAGCVAFYTLDVRSTPPVINRRWGSTARGLRKNGRPLVPILQFSVA